jgi:hypothetical protein
MIISNTNNFICTSLSSIFDNLLFRMGQSALPEQSYFHFGLLPRWETFMAGVHALPLR